MDCQEFRANFDAFDTGKASDDLKRDFSVWADHFHDCKDCGDWALGERVRRTGADPSDYPCIHMAYRATDTCDQHPDRAECHDLIIEHNEKWNEFMIIKGQVALVINFCPWCGVELPPSQRDRWFDELHAKGLDTAEPPERYRSGAWFKQRD